MAIVVIERTFQVLEALARAGGPAPLIRLANESRLPKPTAYRILQSLISLGYAAQEEESGHYFATGRLTGLAERDPHRDVKELARPTMERLHARFDETVNLGVLNGEKVEYIAVVETTQPLRWVVRPGRSDPFHCTALGRAIVAYLPEERRERLLAKACLERLTPKTVIGRTALRKKIESVRRKGWALEEEEAAAGVACLAVSLTGLGAANAAISVSVPVSRLTPRLRRTIVAEFESIAGAKSHE